MTEVKLNKPIEINGENVEIIKFDFDKLRGRDLLAAEKNARDNGDKTPAITFSMTYQTFVAARATGLKYDDILDLSGPDYTSVLAQVNAFLFGMVSETEETSKH